MAKDVHPMAFRGAPPTKGEIATEAAQPAKARAKPKAFILTIKPPDFQTIRPEDTPEDILEALAKEVNWQG
jgi:hypothetical protein